MHAIEPFVHGWCMYVLDLVCVRVRVRARVCID